MERAAMKVRTHAKVDVIFTQTYSWPAEMQIQDARMRAEANAKDRLKRLLYGEPGMQLVEETFKTEMVVLCSD